MTEGQDSSNRKAGDKSAGSGQLGQDHWDRTTGTAQPGQDNRDRTTGTRQPGQDNRDRKAGTGLPERTIGVISQDRQEKIGRPHDIKDRTARTG
jgi:hypothetical protein